MSKVIAPTSHDFDLRTLLDEIHRGKMQLPEFQREWVWDDERIRGIIASITQGYPIGVIMCLGYGNSSKRFKYRPLEGAEAASETPTSLILDGQQRMTSIFCAAFSDKPVNTRTSEAKDSKRIQRFYYLDINKCLNGDIDRIDAVISVPEDRKIKAGRGRKSLDLSTEELEYENEMFPVSKIFSQQRETWGDGYKKYHGHSQEFLDKYNRFLHEVIFTVTSYKLPVINLDADTPKEAVCRIFENVNTGGIVLTVFDLVTASFAADDFNLRDDWEKCRDIITGKDINLNTDIMNGVDEVSFLTAVTAYSTYMKKGTYASCNKRDVLNLSLTDYQIGRDAVLEGYKIARDFLFRQYIFHQDNLPYPVQLTSLAAICAVIGRARFNQSGTTKILENWFWCGVFGRKYGKKILPSTLVSDIEDVVGAIEGKRSPAMIRTVTSAFFSSAQLISTNTKSSAGYKGIIALLYREGCRDFISGTSMNVMNGMNVTPDVHHIFPKAYCKGKYPLDRCDSIINKTPLLAASNRSIGKDAPSVYSARIMHDASIDGAEFRKRIESNLINYEAFIYEAFIADDFNAYFIDRAKKILQLIEKVMGKPITDKDSPQTIELYGESLA